MKYDLQILIPIVPKRLRGFQKYGTYNLKDKKVLIHCLVGKNDRQLYENGWSENIDVEIINHEEDNPIVQIYDFLSKMTTDDLKANWFAKIDDDTYNDIYRLVTNFEKLYDAEKEFYIVTRNIRHEIEECEIQILRKIEMWENIGEKFTHELEGCWLSKKAMQSILENKKCKELFFERSKTKKGFTDQCIGAAARICKIHPVESYFCSTDEMDFFQCSLFKDKLNIIADNYGQTLFHFHPICKLKNERNYNLILKIFDDQIIDLNLEKLVNQNFFLVTKHNGQIVSSISLVFLPNNIVNETPNIQFGFYFMSGDDLVISRKTPHGIIHYVFRMFDLTYGTNEEEPEFTFELYKYK